MVRRLLVGNVVLFATVIAFKWHLFDCFDEQLTSTLGFRREIAYGDYSGTNWIMGAVVMSAHIVGTRDEVCQLQPKPPNHALQRTRLLRFGFGHEVSDLLSVRWAGSLIRSVLLLGT